MKWESDELEEKPENVFIEKWLPQDDILAHKNVKLFISHCGLGSITEAKYHGVPILAIPLLGDQPENALQIKNEGWSMTIDLATLSEDSILKAIEEMLFNSTYTKNVKKLSSIIRDRPKSSQETALYWIEYVLRHKGAPHLHYPGANLNFIQKNSIDILVFVLCVASLALGIINIACKAIFRRKMSTLKFINRKKKN